MKSKILIFIGISTVSLLSFTFATQQSIKSTDTPATKSAPTKIATDEPLGGFVIEDETR